MQNLLYSFTLKVGLYPLTLAYLCSITSNLQKEVPRAMVIPGGLKIAYHFYELWKTTQLESRVRLFLPT